MHHNHQHFISVQHAAAVHVLVPAAGQLAPVVAEQLDEACNNPCKRMMT